MLLITLDRMADGGMYDQLGGGFARYSTDAAWHVPHFEKMLYDNAQLAQVYTRAWQVTRRSLPARRRGDTGLPAAGDAASGGRVLVLAGRRQRRRRRPVLHVVVGGTCRAGRGGGRRLLRRHARGELGGRRATNVLRRPLALVGDRARDGLDPGDLDRRGRGRARRPVRGASGASTLAPTTRSSRRGTPWRSGLSRRRAAPSTNRRYVEAAVRCATFVLAHLRDEGGRLLAHGGTGWPAVPPSPTTMR